MPDCFAKLENNRLTARGWTEFRRVSWTLADLAEVSGAIDEHFVIEALAMRTRVGKRAGGWAA